MWKLTIEDDEGKQTALPLAHEEYGLGRGESNAIRLTDRNISRTHSILKKTGLAWFLKDLQSYNGTFVNGVRVVGEQALSTGDVVQIGDYRLELIDDATLPVATVPGAPPAPAPAHQRPNRLVVVVGPVPGAEFPLDKESFTIGRSEEATISVNHSSVSRVHAELIPIGNGRFEIVDKASANGIRINGVELKRGILEAGDALELGDVRMRFVGAGKIFRTGVDQSQQLATAAFDNGAPSMVSSNGAKPGVRMGKLVGLGVGVGVAVIAVVVMLLRPSGGAVPGGSGANPDSAHVTGEGADLLKQALEKLAAKDVDGAHLKIQEIPESSTVRDDPAVKQVEGAWADQQFAKVEQAPDSAAKKEFLRTVSATPSVDAARRKKAADMVREIEAKEPPPVVPAYVGGDFARPNGTATAAAATPSAAPTSTPVQGGGSTIPSGIAAEDAQRKALEPKVFGGRASVDEIRMLKAICSHLGNRDCRDRASAMLKKKLESQP
jgi:pSer/pThr/pTyr-binding forkhead associated (FHA) protein